MKLDFNCKSIDFSEKKINVKDTKSKDILGKDNKFNDKLKNIDREPVQKNIDSKEETMESELDEINYYNLYSFLQDILSETSEHLKDTNIEFSIENLNDFVNTIELDESTEQGNLEKIFKTIDSLFSKSELNDIYSQLDRSQVEGINNLEEILNLMDRSSDDLGVKKILEKNLSNLDMKASECNNSDNIIDEYSKENDTLLDLLDVNKVNSISDNVSKNESITVLERIANVNSQNKGIGTEFNSEIETNYNLELKQNNESEVRDLSGSKITSYISSTNTQQDIVRAFKYINQNGLEQMTIRLKPEELGELSIKLSKQDGEMIGLITVSNKSVYELVNKNALDLRQHLESLDINIKELNVNVSDQGAQQFDLSKRDFNRDNYREENQKQFNSDEKEKLSTEPKNKIEENTEERLDVLA